MAKYGFGLIPTPRNVLGHGTFGTGSYVDGPDADDHLSPFILRGQNQNPTNTCVWFAFQNAMWTILGAEGLKQVKLSVNGGYYGTRMKTHRGNRDLIVDTGCRPPDAADLLNEWGWIPESEWPFHWSKVNDEPDWKALVSFDNKWFFLRRIIAPYGQRGKAIRHIIHHLNRPVLIGQEVTKSYLRWRPGDSPWSYPMGTIPEGRHMELIATYDTLGPDTVSSWGDPFERKLAWSQVEHDSVTELWYPDIDLEVAKIIMGGVS